MASRLDRILEGPPRGDTDAPRTGAPKEGLSGSHRSRDDTPPAPAQSRAIPHPQPPPAPKAGDRAKPQAIGLLTRGRAAASGKGETGRRSASPGARQAGDAEPRPMPVCEGPGASTRGGSRPAGRGTGRRAVLPVGKVFDAMILIFLCLCVLSCNGLSHVRSTFFRSKRMLEQAQPSMAKRLKVGAAFKDLG